MRVLIVEDERGLAESLERGLRREGLSVSSTHDGLSGLALVSTFDPDVIILDRDLPGISGDALCTTLRSQNHPARIIMLTAAGTLDDRIAGFDLGADDYLPKPFAYAELLARLRALGRRGSNHTGTILEAGTLRLDVVRRTDEHDGRPLQLTPKEFGVLEVLLSAGGAWVSAEELYDEVWETGSGFEDSARSVVKVTVYTLRRKIGATNPIENATGFGYRIWVTAPNEPASSLVTQSKPVLRAKK
jgi:DNA-binding response OmpR family regulator